MHLHHQQIFHDTSKRFLVGDVFGDVFGDLLDGITPRRQSPRPPSTPTCVRYPRRVWRGPRHTSEWQKSARSRLPPAICRCSDPLPQDEESSHNSNSHLNTRRGVLWNDRSTHQNPKKRNGQQRDIQQDSDNLIGADVLIQH